MTTLAPKNHPPIDITSPSVQPGLPFLFPLTGTQRHRLWQAVKITAGCVAATAVLVIGWFVLLNLVYQSFARSILPT